MFWHFGYGSNMDLTSLRAKGIEPRVSERAVLADWRLRFNVRHFFRHEGGVANIEPAHDALVWGVVHRCEDEQLAYLDAAEACGHGYNRIDIAVRAEGGERRAVAYVGTASFLDDKCNPTQRYLNILVRGAIAAGVDPAYVDALRRHQLHQSAPAPAFVPPSGAYPIFNAATLRRHPLLTALAGSVFDMSGARRELTYLHGLFGGKDMSLFVLKRLDDSCGQETIEDVKQNRLSARQRQYLSEYLHQYSREFTYVGRYLYE
jgi:sulfite reductase (NADPH) flavoprotein alpha-component